jgi:hypothetical protein
MKKLLLFLGFLPFLIQAQSSCPIGTHEIIIEINPDNFPTETSWEIKNQAGLTWSSGNEIGDTLCLFDTLGCMSFTIYDSYGDGICCNYGLGSYLLVFDNDTLRIGGEYGYSEQTSMNCDPGETCQDPIMVDTLSYIAPARNSWYSFKPPIPGMYDISTCDTLNSCDTRLWVYENCPSNPTDPTNMQTILYNDNSTCGLLAVINGALDSSKTYLIRIGDDGVSCSDSIHFSIDYNGPISGCTDPLACNYNPLATVSDTCYYLPNPLCGLPDLRVVRDDILSSITLSTTPGDFCEVQEGCMNGYGTRTVIEFTTTIENIGTEDYHIGDPTTDPSQFSFDNCHGHAHYEGYAKYSLIDDLGNWLPIGSKNGFCVMDLSCPSPIIEKYNCGNMGITAGCKDIYSNGVGCQLVDITDIDSGDYTLRVEVNWDHSPDRLGRYELTYDNNAADVCIHVAIDASGQRSFSLLPTCDPWLDCAGTPEGTAVRDCNGVCNGSNKHGDLDVNLTQEMLDVSAYTQGILDASIAVSSCTDLHADTQITVFDAALLQKCVQQGSPTNEACVFPRGVLNPTSGVTLTAKNFNWTDLYFDVYITNPLQNVLGYEYTISGATIVNVKDILIDAEASVTPEFNVGGLKVIGLAYTDSTISKNYIPTAMSRVYFNPTGGTVCIDEIIHIVSEDFELVNTSINSDSCQSLTVSSKTFDPKNFMIVYPNPSRGLFSIECNFSDEATTLPVFVYNVMGERVLTQRIPNHQMTKLDLQKLPKGMYTLEVSGVHRKHMKQIVIQ